MSPARGERNPKKATDHKAFNMSCRMKMASAHRTLTCLQPILHIRNAEIPMRKYSVVHTGMNSHDGGVKDGLIRVGYHCETERLVKKPPIPPAASQMRMLTTSPIALAIVIPFNCGSPSKHTAGNIFWQPSFDLKME